MIRNMRWLFGVFCAIFVSTAFAVDLRGSASINITSETAAAAKNKERGLSQTTDLLSLPYRLCRHVF